MPRLASLSDIRSVGEKPDRTFGGKRDCSRRRSRLEANRLVDAAAYLRLPEPVSDRSGPSPANLRSTGAVDVLVQAERCRRLGLIVIELARSALSCARSTDGGREINIELMREGSFVHCAVSGGSSDGARAMAVPQLDVARGLAKGLGGWIGHWFDDQGACWVVTVPLTKRERKANNVHDPAQDGAALARMT